MKAVVYQAPFSIAAENVPDPELQHPNDGIVKITSSCIGGADLHMYEGRTATQPSNASRPRRCQPRARGPASPSVYPRACGGTRRNTRPIRTCKVYPCVLGFT